MSYGKNIYHKRGRWHTFLPEEVGDAFHVHVDRKGLVWWSGLKGIKYSDGAKVFSLAVDCEWRNIESGGFTQDDKWYGITEQDRLLTVDLATAEVSDHTELLKDFPEAYWIWTSPSRSEVLIGTPGLLAVFDGSVIKALEVPKGEMGKLNAAALSHKGDIWFDTSDHLFRYDGDTTHSIGRAELGVSTPLWEIVVAHDDTAWVATDGEGVITVSPDFSTVGKGWSKLHDYSPAAPVFEDREGNVWIRNRSHAISCVTPDGEVYFTTQDGISSPNVFSMTQDAQGKIWCACQKAGISFYDASSLVEVTPYSISSTCRTDDEVFLGTPTEGLLKYKDGQLTTLNSRVQCGDRSSLTFWVPHHLVMFNRWLAQATIVDIDTGDITRIDGLPRDKIRKLVKDESGAIWFSTKEHLYRADRNGFSCYPFADIMDSSQDSFFIATGIEGQMIVCGRSSGERRFYDGKEFRSYDENSEVASENVVARCEAKDGSTWIGTKEGRLFRFTENGAQEIQPHPPMSELTIRCMTSDSNGNIWIGTNRGLLLTNGCVFQKMLSTVGLPSMQITGLDRLGETDILISTLRGAFRYRPDYSNPPHVSIPRVDAGTTYHSPAYLDTHAGVPAITIHLSGASTKIGSVKFRYTLEGHDGQWHETWNGAVTYKGLPPGDYVFKVCAHDINLVASDQTASLPLHIYDDPSKAQLGHLENELQNTKDFSHNIIRSLHDAILILDGNGTVTTANYAALNLLGYAQEAVVGRQVTELLCGDDRELLGEQGIKHVLGQGLLKNHECCLLAANGKQVPVLLSASMMCDSHGDLQGIVVVATDMTGYNDLQDQLQRKQKMESLGVLAGGIAHDFNNLLGVIIGNTDLMRADLSEDSDAAQCAGDVLEAAQHAAKLCQELLEYTGKAVIQKQEVDLSQQVEALLDLMRTSVSKKIALESTLDPSLPYILAGESQVGQIVLNLVTNASEAIGGNSGKISIVTRVALLEGEALVSRYARDDHPPPGEYVILEVSDDGCGMDDATLERICDPFYSSKFAGRGLGLASVHGIIHKHHGILRVESTPDVGSKFTVAFPALREHDAVRKAETTPNIKTDYVFTGKVLLVDDEAPVLAVGKRILKRMGFSVVTASDGAEAVETFKEYKDDLSFILMDLTMPGMDGKDAYNEIKRISVDIPVIMSSGYSETSFEQHFGDDAVAFLHKPYTRAQLEEVLMTLRITD